MFRDMMSLTMIIPLMGSLHNLVVVWLDGYYTFLMVYSRSRDKFNVLVLYK
jgi:hypothetical protein